MQGIAGISRVVQGEMELGSQVEVSIALDFAVDAKH
jgi:hypothetical protein